MHRYALTSYAATGAEDRVKLANRHCWLRNVSKLLLFFRMENGVLAAM